MSCLLFKTAQRKLTLPVFKVIAQLSSHTRDIWSSHTESEVASLVISGACLLSNLLNLLQSQELDRCLLSAQGACAAKRQGMQTPRLHTVLCMTQKYISVYNSLVIAMVSLQLSGEICYFSSH